jgi:hypothetical protein
VRRGPGLAAVVPQPTEAELRNVRQSGSSNDRFGVMHPNQLSGGFWPHCDIHERLITESPRPLAAPATAGS